MRAISKWYSLKIATHTSNVIVLLEPRLVLSQQIQTARVSGRHLSTTLPWFIKRYKCPKVFNMWSSRTCVMLSISNSYVCHAVVTNRTIFVFFSFFIDGWNQLTLFPKWNAKNWTFCSKLDVHQNHGLLFWHRKTKRHSCLNIRRKEKYTFSWKQRRQLSCVLYGDHSKVTINMLFLEVVLRSGRLNWNNLDMSLRIAMSCILWKQPENNWILTVNATWKSLIK